MSTRRARTIAVCVPTYCRPTTLQRLLDALLELQHPDRCAVQLRVVDNDVAGSAAVLVEAFARRCGGALEVRYCIEPRPGVTCVRNTAIELGAVDLVAFLDDDEWPTPTWLVDLVTALDDSGADAVVGPVVAALDEQGPCWRGPRFRGAPCPSAGAIPWVVGRTGNVLIRGVWLYERGFRFDEQFALTGGEDADFFSRLDEAGARFVASTALVYVHVDEERLALSWLLRRQRQHGMNFERIRARRADARPAVLRATGHVVRLGWMAARATVQQALQQRFDADVCLEVALRAAWVTGLIREQLHLSPTAHYGSRVSSAQTR
jgi:succinoglycan biosynthesis protein ExoM